MLEILNIMRGLGDESRIRILLALRHGELCLCQIIALLELAPSTVSSHMALLARAGLVQVRKQGRWHYYRLIADSAAAQGAIEWLRNSVTDDALIRADDAEIQAIKRMELGQLCSRYKAAGCSPAPPANRAISRSRQPLARKSSARAAMHRSRTQG